MKKLLARDPAGALGVLEVAIKGAPDHAPLWLNMATALRDLGRTDDELAALNKALRLEPTNMRALLQAGALHERVGDQRTAAATYRKALMLIPPGVQVPPAMRPFLDQARRSVAANGAALEAFLESHLQDARSRFSDQPLGRFDKSLATFLQKRRVYRPQPTFLYVPELPAIEFYDRADFPWLDSIEAATNEIRDELVNVLADGPSTLEPYISLEATPDEKWRALNNSRSWGVFYLWKAGQAMSDNMARVVHARWRLWRRGQGASSPALPPLRYFPFLSRTRRSRRTPASTMLA